MGLICKWKWAGLRFQAHFNQWQCISRNLKESGRGPFSLTGRLPTWSATAFVTSPFPRSGEWIGWPPRLRDPLRVWPPWWCGFSAAPRWCRSDLQRGLGQTLEGLWPHILWSHAGPRCASASLEPSLSRWGWVRQTGVGEPCRLVGGMWTCGKVLGGQFFMSDLFLCFFWGNGVGKNPFWSGRFMRDLQQFWTFSEYFLQKPGFDAVKMEWTNPSKYN